MRALDGRALVALAIAEHLRFKDVFAELERRPVDDDAADALVAAYRDGSAPPWLTAALLGETRSARGYEVLSTILYDAPRLLAESYAGVAMAKVRGVDAAPDLRRAMHEAPELRSREGAAYGLSHLARAEDATAILAAARDGRIRVRMVGGAIADCEGITPDLLRWLSGGDPLLEHIAIDAAFALSARQGGRLDGPLATAVASALEAGRVSVAPSLRTMLIERIARGRAG